MKTPVRDGSCQCNDGEAIQASHLAASFTIRVALNFEYTKQK